MWWWVLACTCGEPRAPVPVPGLSAPGHYTKFDRLVRAVALSDLLAAQQHARDLSQGAVEDDHEGASKVGAALGFAQVADTVDELPFAISRAAAGCGACHRDRGVVPPVAPPFAHTTAAARAAWGVVWGVDEPLPAGVVLEPAVVRAWGAEDRVSAVLEACQGCHP